MAMSGKECFNTIILMLITFMIYFVLSILILMKGWGLNPKSWWWIIGMGIFAKVILPVIMRILNEEVQKYNKERKEIA